MKFRLDSGLPSSQSRMEKWSAISFYNNCERQIIAKCLPGFSRILDTLREGKNAEHGKWMKQKTVLSEIQVTQLLYSCRQVTSLSFGLRGKLSDGIQDKKKTKSWQTPLSYLFNRLGRGRICDKGHGKECRELDKKWLEIQNGRSTWRNFLATAAFYMGFGVRAKMAVHCGPDRWVYRWGGSALCQV